jgi:pimeloyl-ACP methyl ester carboxylesterase
VEDVAACRKELSSQAKLSEYSTMRAAEDIDRVREALHADKIDIWSLSYGTRLAQQYIKAFPTRVRRAVMAGFAPLDYRTPLYHAMNAQRVIDLLLYKCRADESCNSRYPNLPSEWAAVLTRLDHSPAQVKWKGSKASVERGRFAENIRNTLVTAAGQREFPKLVHALYKGNFDPYLRILPDGPSPFAMGLYLTIACSEGAVRIGPADIKRYTDGTFLGEYRVRQELAACAEWPTYKLPANFFSPPESSPPLLLISGEMDSVEAPDYAEQFCSKLESCHVAIIPNLGHGPFDLDAWKQGGCYDAMAAKFLASGIVDNSCVNKMHPPDFR